MKIFLVLMISAYSAWAANIGDTLVYNGVANTAVATNIINVSGTNVLIKGTAKVDSVNATNQVTAAGFNKVAITSPATAATLTIANNKTATINNTLTFSGTDSSTIAFGTGGTAAYLTTDLSAFAFANALTWPDGVRQVFNPNATVAGINVGAQAGDPSTPVNGDLWYDSTGNLFRARINGASVSLGAGASVNGILQSDGAGNVSAVTIGANLTYAGGSLSASGGGSGGGTTNEPGWYIANAMGMVNDNSTDNTSLLTNVLWAILGDAKTNIQVEATVQFAPGIYKFTGIPKNWTAANELCTIPVPLKTGSSGGAYGTYSSKLHLRGASKPGLWPGSNTGGTAPTNGTVFLITSTNAGWFFSSLGFPQVPVNDLSYNLTTIEIEGITFMTPTNSQLGILGLGKFPNVNIHDDNFLNQTLMSGSTPQPLPGHWAIQFPIQNCGNMIIGKMLAIDGYEQAIRYSEHGDFNLLNITSCGAGLVAETGLYENLFGHVELAGCPTNILGLGANLTTILDAQIENISGGGWRTLVWDFADSNGTKGDIYWKKVNDVNTALNNRFNISSTGTMRLHRPEEPGMWLAQSGESFGFRGQYGMRYTADATGNSYFLYKGRGSYGSPSAASSGDSSGQYGWGFYDGTTFPGIVTAYINAVTTGSVSAGNAPTRVDFAVGHSSAAPTQMSITETQVTVANDLALTKTITTPGTTGAQTINKTSGRVNFAASAQTLVVTDSFVTTSSIIMATVKTDDVTATTVKVSAQSAGSFTLKLNATATAETAVDFIVTN